MNSPKRVLFMARRFPPSVGGMERFAYDLSNALDDHAIVTKITWGGSNTWLPLVLPVFFLRAFWQLATKQDIEIIHMQDAVQAPVGWLLHKIFNKPYIVVAHGLDVTYEKFLYQQLILPFVRRADAVVSISSATNEEVLKRGIQPAKTQVITLGTHDDYGVDVAPDRSGLEQELNIELSDRPLLLTTGRLVKRKGVAWFIENVMPVLVTKYSNVLYMVAGEGSERERIEEAIHQARLADNVLLLGRVSERARSLLYRSCDIFVMPNVVVAGDMEGFGIVAQEAATAQLPVVASGIEGIQDAIRHEKNGMLVETGNQQAFVDEISTFLDNVADRRAFGKAARAFTLNEYSWKNIAEKYAAVYEALTK